MRAPKYDLTPPGYKPIRRYRKHWVPPERMPKQENIEVSEEIVGDLGLDDALRFLAQTTISPSDIPRPTPPSPAAASQISWEEILAPRGERLTVSERMSRTSSPTKSLTLQ